MIKIYINNEEVVCSNVLTITEEMLSTSSTILNNCYPLSWEETKDYVNNFYFPQDYSKCRIYQDNTLIFAGVVKNTGNISLNPRDPKYCSLQLLDFKALLSEGDLLDFVINEKTITEAIQMIVDAVAEYGVVLGEVNILNGNDIIGAYSTLNKTAYDVFQYLAEISGSRWSTRLIDENTIAVDFYDPSLMEEGEAIQYTKQWFCSNEIDNIVYNYSTNDYRNKQVMLSDQVYGGVDYNENIISNGYNNVYSTIANIGKLNSVTINGVSQTIATNFDKEAGIEADFYYDVGNNAINSEKTYSAGTEIIINYTPLVQGREIVFNDDEVLRITDQINRKGVISRYENRNDITSSDDLNKIGQTYIKYKGSAEVTLKVSTRQNIWEIGQTVMFNSPIEALQKNYMVKKKITKIITTIDTIFYEYELSSSFNSENAINYFDNQRAKNKGNISDGEFINRNIDIYNTANIIFDNLQCEEVQIVGDNALDFVLDSPFIV